MTKLIEFENCKFDYKEEKFIEIPEGAEYILKTNFAFKSYEELEKLFEHVLMVTRLEIPQAKSYHFGRIEVKGFKDVE